jgi:hypothetical protein
MFLAILTALWLTHAAIFLNYCLSRISSCLSSRVVIDAIVTPLGRDGATTVEAEVLAVTTVFVSALVSCSSFSLSLFLPTGSFHTLFD